MRPFRLIAGFLTVSLVLGGVLGDVLHVQGSSGVQADDHLVAHTDSADVSALDSLNSDASERSCHLAPSQVAIAAPSGQRTSTAEAVKFSATFVTEFTNCGIEVSRAFSGREAPLFEYASLYAATVSMRI